MFPDVFAGTSIKGITVNLYMFIRTMVGTIQDVMRRDAGVDGNIQRIPQLVWLHFLNVFEDREQELRQLHAPPT